MPGPKSRMKPASESDPDVMAFNFTYDGNTSKQNSYLNDALKEFDGQHNR